MNKTQRAKTLGAHFTRCYPEADTNLQFQSCYFERFNHPGIQIIEQSEIPPSALGVSLIWCITRCPALRCKKNEEKVVMGKAPSIFPRENPQALASCISWFQPVCVGQRAQ